MAARRRSWTGDDEAPALLFATDGASAGQRSDLQVCITPSACVRETARLVGRPYGDRRRVDKGFTWWPGPPTGRSSTVGHRSKPPPCRCPTTRSCWAGAKGTFRMATGVDCFPSHSAGTRRADMALTSNPKARYSALQICVHVMIGLVDPSSRRCGCDRGNIRRYGRLTIQWVRYSERA